MRKKRILVTVLMGLLLVLTPMSAWAESPKPTPGPEHENLPIPPKDPSGIERTEVPEQKTIFILPDGSPWNMEEDGSSLETFDTMPSYTIELGQRVKVKPGTVYYASADYGGSGAHGVIGENEYTTGALYALGYVLLNDDQRVDKYYARSRQQILALESAVYFRYDDDVIDSMMIGLYTDGYTNGAIGWVPANATDVAGAEYVRELNTARKGPDPDLGVPTDTDEDFATPEDIEPEIVDLPDDTNLEEELPIQTPDNQDVDSNKESTKEEYSLWKFLGDLFWAFLKFIGYLILLILVIYLLTILAALAVALGGTLIAALLALVFGAGSAIYTVFLSGVTTLLEMIGGAIGLLVPLPDDMANEVIAWYEKRVARDKKRTASKNAREAENEREYYESHEKSKSEEDDSEDSDCPSGSGGGVILADDMIYTAGFSSNDYHCGISDFMVGESEPDDMIVVEFARDPRYPKEWVAAWVTVVYSEN